ELEIREIVYGRDSRNVIDCMVRIAPNYRDTGDLDGAENMYRKIIPAFQIDYDHALRDRKRLTNERNALISAKNGLLSVLAIRKPPHRLNEPDEYDNLNAEIKRLNEEAATAPLVER